MPATDRFSTSVFKSISTLELIKKYVALAACSNQQTLKLAPTIFTVSKKLSTIPIVLYPLKALIYNQFCGGETETELLQKVAQLHQRGFQTILDYAAESGSTHIPNTSHYTASCFNHYLSSIQIAANDSGDSVAVKFSSISPPFFLQHLSKFILEGVKSEGPRYKYKSISQLLSGIDFVYDKDAVDLFLERINILALSCAKSNIKLYIDAEQREIQPAIDALAIGLMKTHNLYSNVSSAIVHNTYQMYLQGTKAQLFSDLNFLNSNHCHFGAKLVRGAYLEHERLYSLSGFPKLTGSLEETHLQYNDAIKMLIFKARSSNCSILFATHNLDSILLALNELDSLDNSKKTNFSFAQLLGMGDFLSYNIRDNGYATYKYVPYGVLTEVFPYLLRRINENSSMVKNVHSDLKIIKEEIKNRFF